MIASQHRIAALRQYVEKNGLAAEELWWTCEIYCRGEARPPSLYSLGSGWPVRDS